jgi:hypothetical protein
MRVLDGYFCRFVNWVCVVVVPKNGFHGGSIDVL